MAGSGARIAELPTPALELTGGRRWLELKNSQNYPAKIRFDT